MPPNLLSWVWPLFEHFRFLADINITAFLDQTKTLQLFAIWPTQLLSRSIKPTRLLTAAVFVLVEVLPSLHVLAVVVIPGIEIPQGFVPSHHICAFHTTFLTGSFPDPKLCAVGPNNLGKMPGTPGTLRTTERIPGTANLVIPATQVDKQ